MLIFTGKIAFHIVLYAKGMKPVSGGTMFNQVRLEKSMQQLKSGDSSAFDIIYEETHRMVFYIVYPIIKDYSRAEDLTQDVFMKIYEKINQYSQSVSPKAWIAMIAKNTAINEYKRQKRETIIDNDTADLIMDEKPTRRNTPLIDLAAKHLLEEEFMIVMLCVGEGYKRREVAEMLNLSTSGVTWKLEQALNKLRKIIEKEG
jgi:RNA polymerase sigma-70 factor (ECF subfamily)